MDRLFTRSYIFILAANFLMFFGFWLLIPILPFYLTETFSCPQAALGAILSCYTVSCLAVRPFSGFLMDKFPRKPIYIFCYFLCMAMLTSYIFAATLTWFIILRAIHGFAFGGVTVGGNTLCVDIMPSSRRGEGLGYYGLMNNTAMALGPMTGLFMHGHVPYTGIFMIGMSVSAVGLLCALAVSTKKRSEERGVGSEERGVGSEERGVRSENSEVRGLCQKSRLSHFSLLTPHSSLHTPHSSLLSIVSLDRFILLKGIPVSIALLLLSIPYGATTNFVAMYASEIRLDVPTGFFFTLMAVGMGFSRIVAGKQVDRGYVTQCIHVGYYPVILAFLTLGMCRFVVADHATLATVMFYIVPTLLGIGFGVMFPAMNTLYINLARHDQRATATSTYLTAWDVGLGIGVTASGIIAQHFTFYMVYLVGSAICLVSLLIFTHIVTPHYNKNKRVEGRG
ncbi:MAG: MFS transporter [Prevotella sp.]